nr:permease [Methanocaldococcus infernus]
MIIINTVIDYLTPNRVIALLTAFLMAGGISALIDKEIILRYFSSENRVVSYLVASVSGAILTVCSCTVIPLFASIYKKGANIGPAVTLLYSAPAINILAIFYSAAVLGWDIGILRAVFAIVISIVIGLIMEFIFREKKEEKRRVKRLSRKRKMEMKKLLIFFALLLLMLLDITASPKFFPQLSYSIYGSFLVKHLIFVILAIIFSIYVKLNFDKREIKSWLLETKILLKIIFPLLILGIAIAGVIKALIPPEYVANYVGQNTIFSNLIASLIGATMYFATLTEVPIVKSLMDLGMNVGPAMALLLAGPSLSIPTVLAVSKIMGYKKALTYFSLVVIFSALCGYLTGFILSQP